MATALYRLGRAAFRRRRLVLAIWLVLFAGMGVAAGTLSGPTNDRFSIPGTESQQAVDLLSERLPQANGASGRIVFAAPEGEQLSGTQRTAVQDALASVARTSGVLAVSDPFRTEAVSRDGRIALSSVTFRDDPQSLENSTREAVEQAADGAEGRGRAGRVRRRRRAAGGRRRRHRRGDRLRRRRARAGDHVRLARRGRAAAADRARRRRHRHARDHDDDRLRRPLLDDADARADARPRGRDRLRAVHHLAPPDAAVRGARTGGVGRPRRRHRRQRRRLRRRDCRDRARRADRRRDPVPDRDGPRRRRDRRRRRAGRDHARARAARLRRHEADEGQELRDRQARRDADDGLALGRASSPAIASPRCC